MLRELISYSLGPTEASDVRASKTVFFGVGGGNLVTQRVVQLSPMVGFGVFWTFM